MSRAAGNIVTKEHVLPLWLMPYLGDPAQGGVTHTIRQGVRGPVLREWTTDTLDLAAKKVCRECNNGWMNDLENLAKPHLIPLLEGNRRVLDAPTQRILAAWAVKTALALGLANAGAKAIDVEHYRALTTLKRRPPPKTHVWLSAYRGWRHAFHHQSTLTLTDSKGSVDGYASTVSVTRPIFHVAGHSHAHEVDIVKGGIWPFAAVQIWPVLGLAHWPTRMIVDDDQLLSMATTWKTRDFVG
ncbi:hypothetical protein [Candidatus Solirubrobacter pratensis]|uniref:hypothetical protein n=1 Tax=Candidatus Solirubrobacter pratensis TaxID=1298857 RepID=UPI00048781BB|nr:hypothetical protein [Candidatus Solirubrobacter pratensis]